MVESNASIAEMPMAYATSVRQEAHAQTWACPQCTLLNPETAEWCSACLLEKPRLAAPQPSNLVAHAEVEHIKNDANDACIMPHQNNHSTTQVPLVIEDNNEAPFVAFVEEDPIQKKRRRRRRRRIRMVVGGIGGLIGGAIIFAGPAGLVFGAVAGVAGTRFISKRRENKKDADLARVKAACEHNERMNNPPQRSR